MAVQNKSTVPIGTVLEGKFRVTREIGRGGMAAVYEAENIDIGKRVAVKVLAAELITSRVVRERFIREARAASAVRSPHICDVYDSGMFEERPFLVMELLEGESLYDLLTRVRRLDIPTTLSVITQTSRGLGKAHDANIVHRDLKPENIFVTTDDDGKLIVKLLDFGLAKFYEPTNDGDPKTVRLTREGALFGTPAYMSPEQAKGQGEVDHRSDLWALGCIVYECLTGTTVWGVEQGVAMILAQVASAPVPRPSRLRPDLPLSFDNWFAKALDREVSRRFQTAREFSDTLAEALTGDGPSASAASLRQQSIHHESEVLQVDELMARSSSDESGETSPESDGPDGITPEPMLKRAEPASSGIVPLLAAAVLALGGYGAWLTWLHPPGEKGAATSAPRVALTASAKQPKPVPKPAVDPETEPFAALVREAQGIFAKDPKAALEKFKAAYALGSAAPVRALLSHASVAVEEVTPRGCKVTAVARPRPYQLEQAASSPTLARTSEGVLLGWVDNHADARRRQGHVVLLDEALRRKGEPLAVTPEASNVQDLGVVATSDKVVVAFHDDGGKQQGVYVRQLGADGRIASPARRIARSKPNDGTLSLISAGDGFLATWVEELAPGSADLVVMRLSSTLEPKGELVRLTAFPAIKGVTERVGAPAVTVSRGDLELAFSLGFPGQKNQVSLLTVPLAELEKGKGVEVPGRGKRVAANADPVLGALRTVAKTTGRAPQAQVGCEKEGCLIGWDEEKGGAFVAFLEHGKAQPLWHRQFAEKGARPTIVGDEQGLATAWYEEARLRLAPVGRDGVGMPSVVNRVNGLQPHPALARGGKPGEWLLAWRDFEAAHFELFALKAECP